MTWKIRGLLVAEANSLDSLADCRIDAWFDQTVSVPAADAAPEAAVEADTGVKNVGPREVKETETRAKSSVVIVAGRATALSDGEGQFELVLPARRQMASKTLRFTVAAPK